MKRRVIPETANVLAAIKSPVIRKRKVHSGLWGNIAGYTHFWVEEPMEIFWSKS